MLALDPLLALSPLDGRYAGKVEALRPVFSEFGLIHARVRVEIEWLLALAAEPGVPELAPFDEAAAGRLRALADGFRPEDAARAVSFIKPKTVIPVHYNTWPLIAQDPEEFRRLVGDRAEVVRDLHRAENQPEQSYSERQLFEQAKDRMSREIAAVNKLTLTEAVQLIEKNLQKGPRRGAKAEAAEAEEAAA